MSVSKFFSVGCQTHDVASSAKVASGCQSQDVLERIDLLSLNAMKSSQRVRSQVQSRPDDDARPAEFLQQFFQVFKSSLQPEPSEECAQINDEERVTWHRGVDGITGHIKYHSAGTPVDRDTLVLTLELGLEGFNCQLSPVRAKVVILAGSA
ncbi:uncharacterized protein LOC109921544 isoform X1 [Rhincodon typus]|uniref:uncharacterized protein LOC109921544 isoform X1 n=1 Tax=Rhincodon typus TaxID=259920 RepID=UPI002030818E|nr:uncharacterized protein LOC109921544 isoform X1 [Rhincodon typus]